MSREGILMMVRMDILPEVEADWNRWYDTRHIPDRLNIPGFISARRFVAIEGAPKYWSVYDLESVEVLASEPYLQLRDQEYSRPPDSFELITGKLPNISRGLYRQIYPEPGEYQVPDTEFLFAVGFDVPPERQEEFNAWYNTEHIPTLLRVPEFVTARRFVAEERQMPARAGKIKTTPQYVALYDLESEAAIRNESFGKAINTPWTVRIRSVASRRFRFLGRRIYPKQ